MSDTIARLYAELGVRDAGLKQGLANAKEQLNLTAGQMALMAVKTLAAAGAFRMVGKALEDSIRDTAAYGRQVMDLSRVTGNTAENSSKLIQAADDVKLSYESLSTALKMAAKKGFDPSIEGLKQMADEFTQLAPGVEQTQFLMNHFGRSGAEMGKLLQEGSRGIERMAQDAEQAGLVMSGEAVRAAREYEIALDSLDDTVKGVKYSIGNELIPGLTQLIDIYQNRTWQTGAGPVGWIEMLVEASIKGRSRLNELRESAELTQKALESAKGVGDDPFVIKYRFEQEGGPPEIPDLLNPNKDQTLGAADAIEAQNRAIAASYARLDHEMERLSVGMSGEYGKSMESYQERAADLTDQARDLKSQIGQLESKKYLTKDQKKQLEELKGQLGEVQGAAAENAKAQELAGKSFMFGILQQQLAANGLTGDEGQFLMTLAENWGLVDDATLKAYDQAQDWTDQISAAQEQAKTLGVAITELPVYKRIMIDIVTRGGLPNFGNYAPTLSSASTGMRRQGQDTYEDVPHAAQGADFVVPPGYPDDSYKLRVTSGEHVTVTPAGGRPGGRGDTVIQYNFNSGSRITLDQRDPSKPATRRRSSLEALK